MSYAREGVWAGAAPEAVDPQPTTEAVEPQPTVSSTGGFSDAELDAPTTEKMQVAIGATGAYHTHTRAHFTQKHLLLCHMGLY